MSRAIKKIVTRQVFSKRGHPGIEAAVTTEDGITEKAMCTAGLSVGTHEVKFVYDGGKKWRGKGVLKAVQNANEKIVPHLIGLDVTNQGGIDYAMLNICENAKEVLGGNAIAAISAAVLKAGAKSLDIPLYRHIGGEKACVLPVPSSPAITGTRRYGSRSESMEQSQVLLSSAMTFQRLKKLLCMDGMIIALVRTPEKKQGYGHRTMVLFRCTARMYRNDLELFELMAETIREAGYENRVGIQIDVAADTYYCKEDKKYRGLLTPEAKDTDQMIDLYKRMVKDYPVIIIEDPFHEEDYDSHAILTEELDIQVVGDDLFTTNIDRVRIGVEKGATNCVLLKVNQIGTITETLDMINFAYRNGFGVMPCESRGEGETIADYSVGINAGTIRESAINESANRLLEIERELGQKAVFLGKRGLKGRRFQE